MFVLGKVFWLLKNVLYKATTKAIQVTRVKWEEVVVIPLRNVIRF